MASISSKQHVYCYFQSHMSNLKNVYSVHINSSVYSSDCLAVTVWTNFHYVSILMRCVFCSLNGSSNRNIMSHQLMWMTFRIHFKSGFKQFNSHDACQTHGECVAWCLRSNKFHGVTIWERAEHLKVAKMPELVLVGWFHFAWLWAFTTSYLIPQVQVKGGRLS